MKLNDFSLDKQGNVNVRWVKKDGVPHTCLIPCGSDVSWHLAQVSANVVAQYEDDPVSEEDVATITKYAIDKWTQAMIEAASGT